MDFNYDDIRPINDSITFTFLKKRYILKTKTDNGKHNIKIRGHSPIGE